MEFSKDEVIVMKTTFEKAKSNIIHYRDYKKLSSNRFHGNLIFQLSTEIVRVGFNDIERFLQICISTMGEFATKKKSSIRGNNRPSINLTTKSAFTKRSLKNCPENNKCADNKQRKYCVLLLRKLTIMYTRMKKILI